MLCSGQISVPQKFSLFYFCLEARENGSFGVIYDTGYSVFFLETQTLNTYHILQRFLPERMKINEKVEGMVHM